MGSNETAITIPGGPRKIVIFDAQRCAKAQIKHFFGMQIGSRTPSGLGPLLLRRLRRTRCCAGRAIALKVLSSPTSLSNFRAEFGHRQLSLRAMDCPKPLRMRCRRLTNIRRNPMEVREPICIPKKCFIGRDGTHEPQIR